MLDATWIAARQAEAEQARSNFDSLWQDIADFVVPQSAAFTSKQTPGTRRGERVFDSTAIMANVRFAAAMQSMLVPSTQRWHSLVPVDPDLADDHEVRVWCDEVTRRLFALRYAPQAQFGNAVSEGFLSFGAFGNMVIEVSDRLGESIIYRAWHPAEFYLFENAAGVVDAVNRKCEWTARQAVALFGRDVLPPEIMRAAEKSPETPFEFIQMVMPIDEARAHGFERKAPAFMRFASVYYSCTGRKVVREAVYRTFPFAVGRYQTHPGEVYGRGPGDTALADIKMLNEMMKTIIRAAHKTVDPPLMLPNEGVLQTFATRPNALNYGAVDSQGRQLVHPLQTGARIDIGLDMVAATRKAVNDVFHVSLFQVLIEKPTGMTATEAMIRAQEKGALLAPIGQRAQGELLGSLIRRELDIMAVANLLPPMPPALLERGGFAATRVQFSGPIAQAQKAQDGVAIANFAQMLASLVEMYPEAPDRVDFDELLGEMADIQGLPDKVLRDVKDVTAMREQKRQQADAAQAIQAAPLIGKTARDLAQAQAQAAAGPSPLPPAA